ncbi:MAG: GH25 family lysozyme [Streptococcus sp.]
MSVDDYRALARQGVGGVVVKLTEDTWYNNPKAPSQVRNAQIAGLQVSTYHFSRYTTEEEARAEARFYIQAAQKLNLPKSTVMVNDFEDSNMLQTSTVILKPGLMKCVSMDKQLDVLHKCQLVG